MTNSVEKSWHIIMAMHPRNRKRSAVLAANAVSCGEYPGDLPKLGSDCAAHVEAWLCHNGQEQAVQQTRRGVKKRGTTNVFRRESLIVRILNILQGVRQ